MPHIKPILRPSGCLFFFTCVTSVFDKKKKVSQILVYHNNGIYCFINNAILIKSYTENIVFGGGWLWQMF